MATIESDLAMEPAVRLLTVADLPELPDQLPSGPVLYELDNGRLVIMSAPGYVHGRAEARLAAMLLEQGERKGFGEVASGEVSIILGRDPDTVFGADVAFVCRTSLPARLSPEGYLETIPELVAEVRSKNDTMAALNRKAAKYLEGGVRVVWILDPAARTVVEYRPGSESTSISESQLLTAEDIIPRLRIPLSELFA